MSNHLISATPSKWSIKSGETISIAIEYESDSGGSVQLLKGGGFSLSNDSYPAPASPSGSLSVDLSIKREGAITKNCRLVVQFYHTTRELLIEIT